MESLDLSPARWIWFPSERTLQNTFVLFRRIVTLKQEVKSAVGWIIADSRYRLFVNGQRIQWGPSPFDPRFPEADPLDLTTHLILGENVIGIEVLHYGVGDGTWIFGKPGLLFSLNITDVTGQVETVISDTSWLTYLDRAHRPGQFKRWYLRALQEDFNAQLHPIGWNTQDYSFDPNWLPAMDMKVNADKPSICSPYDALEYGSSGTVSIDKASLYSRTIPLMEETWVPAFQLVDSGTVHWKRDPNDWFDYRVPDCFSIEKNETVIHSSDNGEIISQLDLSNRTAIYLTYEFNEEIVGFPGFTIDAPAGTIIELIIQESHDPSESSWLDTSRYCWSRFTCREGINSFEAFDFEALRWLQLHIRNATRPITIHTVGVRRRLYPWQNTPFIQTDEPVLQRLFEAGINTIRNNAQETIVDGMGRERQQYSGDIGHGLHAIRYLYGETRQTSRFLRTFNDGMTSEGYFMDCYPAYDRLWRVAQRHLDSTPWGPLLDHSIGFNFDCWHHFLETGDLDVIKRVYTHLLRFAKYLYSQRRKDGLLPVLNIGIPTVWMDHEAYQQQRHKQCSYNLYAAAMLQHALKPIAEAIGSGEGVWINDLGQEILEATVANFWSKEDLLFVDNFPWMDEEDSVRLSDRSLATAVLYDQCPEMRTEMAIAALAKPESSIGISYPANAGWRYQALIRNGHVNIVLHEWRTEWALMPSVLLNNTLQEGWTVKPNSLDQWCHFPLAPLYNLFMDVAGIRAVSPGFTQVEVRPQLGNLQNLALTTHTVQGPIHFIAEPTKTGHYIQVTAPSACSVNLVLSDGTTGTVVHL